ncbi:MAG: type VI secretion system baseplate subunit TssE [Alphaproteobacteria bacterium]|nr:MAG: type VI secretion system baseplate subunit TssE [Alphaproteobacteria bacterium]
MTTKIPKSLQAPVPLFDRLVDNNPRSDEEPTPLRRYNRDQLKESMHHEIEMLLNTRPGHLRLQELDEPDESVAGTTLFYGAHYFGDHDVTSTEGKANIKHLLAQTIARFEPRLEDIKVEINAFDRVKQRLSVIIDGTLVSGNIREQWSFPVSISDVEITKNESLAS